MTNTTLSFLGDRSTWQGAKVALDDIHGLWGGRRVVVQGDGVAFVTQVDLAQEEQIFRLALGVERALRVFDVCVGNDILAIVFPPHTPVPDEVSTRLEITNPAGQSQTVTHWANGPVDYRFEEARAVLTVVADNMEQFQPAALPRPEPPPAPVQPAPAAPPAPPSPERLLAAITGYFQAGSGHSSSRPAGAAAAVSGQETASGRAMPRCVAVGLGAVPVLSVMPLHFPRAKTPGHRPSSSRAPTMGMALGNFELDFSDGEVRYKTSIDATHIDLMPALIKPMVVTNYLMMDKYFPGTDVGHLGHCPSGRGGDPARGVGAGGGGCQRFAQLAAPAGGSQWRMTGKKTGPCTAGRDSPATGLPKLTA
ncbi:MAG: hypothetical protein KIS63_08705 [Caldilineales bacterium]|nr:hypothetical protein [Caldilineales bacterium]